jgi:homoserine O-succinyltransferase/O-acetyltransferase
LMPLKITTETDLLRLLSNSPLQVEIDFLKIRDHIPKNTPSEHMKMFYRNFDDIRDNKYDGMIITGAPVELLPFEKVSYWDEMKDILDWALHHVYSTMFICWAAQAGLYHYYGIQKYKLKSKISGVFQHVYSDPHLPIFRGFDDVFFMPHSRYTDIRSKDIEKVEKLRIIASSEEAGVAIVKALNGRQLFITGHLEYSRYTLEREYKRDLGKKIPVSIPENYYPGDDLLQTPLMLWNSAANLLFSNWLNYYVYQETPYNIEEIR